MSDTLFAPPEIMTSGPFEGWTTWRNLDPFEDLIGPFYYREGADGQMQGAFEAEPRHMNAGGFMHGGCMLAFADFALFAIAFPVLGDGIAVTVSLDTNFISRVSAGERVEARGDIVRNARSLTFVHGRLYVGDRPVMSFNGIIKPVRSRSEDE